MYADSLVLQKQVSRYDGIMPLCKYPSVSGYVQVSIIDPKASKGLNPKVETDSPECLPAHCCNLFLGSKVRRWESLHSVPTPGSH